LLIARNTAPFSERVQWSPGSAASPSELLVNVIRRFHAAAEVIIVAHMPTRISLLWTVVLLTLPCPLFLVYCLAVVPPVAVLVLSANLIEQEGLLGLAAAALMIGEVAIILVAGRLVVWFLARRLPRQARAIGIAALVVLSLLPIYFLDCMDGQGLTRCSLPMIVRAGFTAGRQCGDLDW